MNLSRLFILRPIATSLLMLAILFSGLLAYRLLPQAALPQVDYPIIQVNTFYPGASAEVMTSLVTAPLERQFGSIAGVQQLSSNSANGVSVITLQFDLSVQLENAEQSVQAAINTAANFLPRDLPSPPIYNKVNPADAAILSLAVTATEVPLTQLQDWVDTRLAQKLAQVSGVGLVTLSGGQRPAVRVQVNPAALASYGLSFADLRSAIDTANSNQAKGNFDSAEQSFALEANSQLKSAADYGNLIVATRAGRSIRLNDVARVIEAAENNALGAWIGQQAAILVSIQRQPGANVIEIVDNIRKLLPDLEASLPASVKVSIISDRTCSVRSALDAVKFELMLAIALVVMVIFLFLRTFAATFIPALAVPLSLVGTFGIMYLAGFSINNLTLMALTIATGFVVDDAIVMIENISRHREMGKSALQSALDGAKQISFTIVSLTFSLLAVLIPLLFMGDIIGHLFREFAITLAVAILISGLVSLTLTPMLCAYLLKAGHEPSPYRWLQTTEKWLDQLIAKYGRSLTWVLLHQKLTLGVVALSIVLTLLLAVWVPKGFFPQQDTSIIQGITEAPQSISFSAMAARQQLLTAALEADPAVANIASMVGVDGINTTLNSGRLQIVLKPYDQRDSMQTVIQHLTDKAQTVSGIQLYLQPLQDITVNDRPSRSQYQLIVESADPEALSQWVPQLQAALGALPELRDVSSNQQKNGRSVNIEIDRDTAARLGVTVAAIDAALYSAFGQGYVSTIFSETNQYRVVMESQPAFNTGLQPLDSIYVPSKTGQQVPLRSLASWREGKASLLVSREKQFPSVTLSFNLANGVALGEAVTAIENNLAQLKVPAAIQTRFNGEALVFNQALKNQLFLILAALVTMYIVLGVLYESYIHPLTVLSTLPSAAIGALLALMISERELTVIAVIGIILLIGIVQKNAIMIIDFALDAQRNQGLSPRDAIYQASLQRFRPILMTSLAAFFSAVPLVFSHGAGAELRQPLGITLIGGLLLSQLLTLFTTPVVYLSFNRLIRQDNSTDVAEELEKQRDRSEELGREAST
ncbi:MAG: efflux RND transporter permease subunit [Pseudomonadota bacterium]